MPKNRRDIAELLFCKDAIEVVSYPFDTASIRAGGRVTPEVIAYVRTHRIPCEIVLLTGEVLFTGMRDKVFLEYFIKQHGIKTVDDVDVWALLCEPFLDTEIDEEAQMATSDKLAACGFVRTQVNDIRNRIGRTMMRHNALVWESVHMGLFHVLQWYGRGDCGCGWKWWQKRQKRQEFYDWACAIAAKTLPLPEQESAVSMQADAIVGEAIRDVAYHFKQSNEHWAYVALGEKISPMIYEAYGSLDRQYHNLFHVAQMLHISEGFALSPRDRAVLRCAILFHDVVYDARAKDNESRSTQMVRDVFAHSAAQMPALVQDIEDVVRLILYSQDYSLPPASRVEQCMADADCVIFAEDAKLYQRYVMNIRREYAHVDEVTWREGRLAFLLKLKAAAQARGDKFFHLLPPQYDAQAWRNLDTEIAQWQALVMTQAA